MKASEFIEKHKKLISKYDVTFTDNCDLWSAVDSLDYYKGDTFLFSITGIGYSSDGKSLVCGDFADYLKILSNGLKEEFKHRDDENIL